MRAALRRILLATMAALVFAPAAAGAHSNSVDSDPKDDARIPTLPRVASVTFNEPVSDAAFALTRPDGQTVKVRASIDGAVVKAALPKDDTKGHYVLVYRVVSEDGHPVTGDVEFTVTTGAAPATADRDAAPSPATTAASTSWAVDPPLFWGVVGGAAVLLIAAILLVRTARR